MVTVYRKTAIKINLAAIRREHEAAANRFVHCEAVKTSPVSFLVLCLLEHVSWLSYTETTSFFFPSNDAQSHVCHVQPANLQLAANAVDFGMISRKQGFHNIMMMW